MISDTRLHPVVFSAKILVLVINKDNFVATKKKQTRYVLVRSGQSGVWIGKYVSQNGDSVTLKDGLKIWRWKGANTTSELAKNGVNKDGFSRVAESSDVTVFGCCELHESNESAYNAARSAGWGM